MERLHVQARLRVLPWFVACWVLLAVALVAAREIGILKDWESVALLAVPGFIGASVLGFALFGLFSRPVGTVLALHLRGDLLVGPRPVRLDAPHRAEVLVDEHGPLVRVVPGEGEAFVFPLPPVPIPEALRPRPAEAELADPIWQRRRWNAQAERFARALLARLEAHAELNAALAPFAWIPREATPPLVEHAVREALAEGTERGGAYRREGDEESEERGLAGAVAWAPGGQVGATPEWLVIREGAALLALPVGHTRVLHFDGATLELEAPEREGEALRREVTLDSAAVASALAGWLKGARTELS